MLFADLQCWFTVKPEKNKERRTDIDQLGIIVTVRIGWYTSTRFRVRTLAAAAV